MIGPAGVVTGREASPGCGSLPVALGAALRRLDALIGRATAAARDGSGPESAGDAYRGLYISAEDAERLLDREPGAPTLHAGPGGAGDDDPRPFGPRLERLAAAFGLAAFDLDVVLVALAPELDLKYERLYAYLQDDVTRKRPGVDLALNLLCRDAGEKLARRAHFGASAPLVRHGLIHLPADPERPRPPLLGRAIKLDDQVVDWLLGLPGPDRRLAPFCRWIEAERPAGALPSGAEGLPVMARRARLAGRPLRVYLHGPRAAPRLRAAAALAGAAGMPLLAADLPRARADAADADEVIPLLLREAALRGAALFLDGVDAAAGGDGRAGPFRSLAAALAGADGVVVLGGERPRVGDGAWDWDGGPPGMVSAALGVPGFEGRRACWEESLAAAGLSIDGAGLDALADRFRLDADQIADAVAAACHLARARAGGDTGPPAVADLFHAARSRTGLGLAGLAQKVEPAAAWDDLVLPDDAREQLREVVARVAARRRVLGAWGFGRRLSQGKGVNALFVGPSGTGKTMAAEVVARALGLDLYKVELSGVVSKWIGETEKNLDRVFESADGHILFFDEADALFGKRSEVHDAHDRYANLEVSHLLQRMESYDGVAVLATNLRGNIDEAFSRRMAFTIQFPFPDEASRLTIWEKVWPPEVPLADDLDLPALARRFKLSGGNIKNAALAAAFLAAEGGGPVSRAHLHHAVRREYQKMGKVLSEAEVRGDAPGGGS